MKGRRFFLFAGLAVLTLILSFSCSLATDNVFSGTGVSLYIGDSGLSRLVTVDEFDVTSLNITLRNGDEVMHTFTWIPYSDNNRIYIPILTEGTFDIDVTHNGINGDETVSVTENAKFRIKLGIITIIKIVPGMVGVIDVEPVEEPVPVNLTGYWDVIWTFDSGVVFGPLHTYLNQTGNEITAPFGMSGTVDGNIFTLTAFMPDPPGLIESSATIFDENTLVDDDFVILDPDTMMPADWGFGPLVGTSLMVRSDPAMFGHLDILGSATTPDGTTMMDLNIEWATATTGTGREEWTDEFGNPMYWEWEDLGIGFLTDVYEVSLSFSIDTSTGESFGAGQSYDFPWPGPLNLGVRYLVDGDGIDETNNTGEPFLFSGTLHIDEWEVVHDPDTGAVVDGHVAGRVETTGMNTMIANFNVPFSPEDPF